MHVVNMFRTLNGLPKFSINLKADLLIIKTKLEGNHLEWWFSYDVVKIMITQNMINFRQILVCPVRPCNMSL